MKYLKGFFKKSIDLSEEDVDLIEDIFLSYIDEINGMFKNKKTPIHRFQEMKYTHWAENNNGIINFYFFGRKGWSQKKYDKKIIIHVWSPADYIKDIIKKYKNRIEKMGFICNVEFETNATFCQDKYGSSYRLREHQIIISKK